MPLEWKATRSLNQIQFGSVVHNFRHANLSEGVSVLQETCKKQSRGDLENQSDFTKSDQTEKIMKTVFVIILKAFPKPRGLGKTGKKYKN